MADYKDPNAFGPTLRRWREERKVSLRKFAERLELSPTYISKVERGEVAPPSAAKIGMIADLLGRDRDEVLALAGKVATDLPEIIRERPRETAALLRNIRSAQHAGQGAAPAVQMFIDDFLALSNDLQAADGEVARALAELRLFLKVAAFMRSVALPEMGRIPELAGQLPGILGTLREMFGTLLTAPQERLDEMERALSETLPETKP